MKVTISKQYTITFSSREFIAMIEDPDLTRRILEHFAQDSVGYPANVSYEDLCGVFNNEGPEKIAYHLLCAAQNDLLNVPHKETHTFGGNILTFDYISGLTAKGGEYVRHTQSGLWQKALKLISDNKIKATTDILVEFLPVLVKETLGISN